MIAYEAQPFFLSYQPMIDCAICYKTFKGEIQVEPKPYIHCVHKPTLTKVLIHPFSLTNKVHWVIPCMHTMHNCQ